MLMSDIIFLYSIDLSARIHAKNRQSHTFYSKYDNEKIYTFVIKQTVYFVIWQKYPRFRFMVQNDWNLSARNKKANNFTANFDSHADQVYYLSWFSCYTANDVYQNLSRNSVQRKIIKNVANFYGNFIKYGWILLFTLNEVHISANFNDIWF